MGETEGGRAEFDGEIEALQAYQEPQVESREQQPEALPAVLKESSDPDRPWTERLSKRATDLIIEYETGGRSYYERKYRSRAVWPKGQSGITIGCGYDLGYVSTATFEADWAALLGGLTTAQRSALAACIDRHSGKDSAAAMLALLASVQDIVVSWEAALAVFFQSTLPKFAAMTAGALPNSDLLNGDCFGALVSLTFNRGASYSKAHNLARDPLDRYREMRAIKSLMGQTQFSGIPAQIRSMVRIWVDTDIEAGMRRRRMDEALLFAEGLATGEAEGSLAVEAESAAALSHLPLSGIVLLKNADLPESADSWDGPSDEDFWSDTGEDEIAEIANKQVVPGSRATGATWAPDQVQPDYSHLGSDLPLGGAFALKAADLALLAGLNDFDLDALGPDTPILFALRGAAIVKDHGDPAGIVLIDQRPDHVAPRCTMGVWDRHGDKLRVFPGSTVPNREAVASYKATRTAGNLLATGLYHYICGAHTTKRRSTPGAFLLRKPDASKRVVIVRRTIDNLIYERGDIVHPCAPGDNIHPTFFLNASGFSSLGCQTVVGTYDGSHQGPWARFRQAAGFTDNDGVPGKRFMYMLLTGAEARIAAQLRVDGLAGDPIALRRLRRLRFGSEGEATKRLQTKLGLPDPDGSFGRNTAEALHVHQSRAAQPAGSDGIYSPAMDENLGWAIFTSG